MPQFGPVVIAAISNHEEFSVGGLTDLICIFFCQVCQMAIGAVGDLARALDSTLAGGKFIVDSMRGFSVGDTK